MDWLVESKSRLPGRVNPTPVRPTTVAGRIGASRSHINASHRLPSSHFLPPRCNSYSDDHDSSKKTSFRTVTARPCRSMHHHASRISVKRGFRLEQVTDSSARCHSPVLISALSTQLVYVHHSSTARWEIAFLSLFLPVSRRIHAL